MRTTTNFHGAQSFRVSYPQAQGLPKTRPPVSPPVVHEGVTYRDSAELIGSAISDMDRSIELEAQAGKEFKKAAASGILAAGALATGLAGAGMIGAGIAVGLAGHTVFRMAKGIARMFQSDKAEKAADAKSGASQRAFLAGQQAEFFREKAQEIWTPPSSSNTHSGPLAIFENPPRPC